MDTTAPPSPVVTGRGVSWPDLLGEHFVELDVATDLPGPVHGTVQSRTVDGLQLSRVRSVDQRVHRTPGLTRSDPRSYLQMGLVQSGQGRVQQDGRECWLGAGDFVLYEVFSDIILNISSPGTGPMYSFKNLLNVDSICIGSTVLLNKMHSPNEFTNIDLLNKATKCFIEIITKMAQYNQCY